MQHKMQYECDFRCGFSGSYEEVHEHERHVHAQSTESRSLTPPAERLSTKHLTPGPLLDTLTALVPRHEPPADTWFALR